MYMYGNRHRRTWLARHCTLLLSFFYIVHTALLLLPLLDTIASLVYSHSKQTAATCLSYSTCKLPVAWRRSVLDTS